MIKNFFAPSTNNPRQVGNEKIAQHVKTKKLLTDVGDFLEESKKKNGGASTGIFFDTNSVVIAVAVGKHAFLNEMGGMTSDGIVDVMSAAGRSLAEARKLPPRQSHPKALINTMEEESEPTQDQTDPKALMNILENATPEDTQLKPVEVVEEVETKEPQE